ncbi:MAG: phosphoribosylformimino-5-aminoimidazole carboxamide ribotide isomerase [Polyangiaceae bacterium]|nr:phosphoribosylformimino-5-aminoimidazole carboxamide ribotide isomerase [Polyangiaceae bacterium]
MTVFRPCIDLHEGRVKQIVGGSLRDSGEGTVENHVAPEPAEYFAALYRKDDLRGGHVIQLGPGNRSAAESALATWPGALQIGGGITSKNAQQWLDLGAAQVIVTSYLFESGDFSWQRLRELSAVVPREQLVLDLSCRRVDSGWNVATDRWQTITSARIEEDFLQRLEEFCCEFLIHAADVEGLCQGIDAKLVETLAKMTRVPCTYAGGARSLDDLALVESLSDGKIDLTFGSALDLFGGSGVRYEDCVAWNRTQIKG